MSPERDTLWTRLEKTSFLTTNEKRAAAGYGPLPNGDEIKRALDHTEKFNPHHVPAGNGRESGQFTSDPDGDGEKPQPVQFPGRRGGGGNRKPPNNQPPPKPGHNQPPRPLPVPPIVPPPGSEPPDDIQRAIDAYRAQHNMPPGDGTVAHALIDGKPVFGVNSTGSGYTVDDRMDATALRDLLINKYPDVMRTDNIGYMPNNALYHAETTLLLRAARDAGGNLNGRTIEMRVDRRLCDSCDVVLPVITRELGNPTIILRDTIKTLTIRNGRWAK